MNKMMVTLALAGLATMPALAMAEQDQTKQVAMPRTVQGRLTLYEMRDYSGDSWEIDRQSGTVHTDWPIRSITVHPGDSWQICARPRYRDCITLNRSLTDASAVGIENQIGSARLAPAAGAPNQGN